MMKRPYEILIKSLWIVAIAAAAWVPLSIGLDRAEGNDASANGTASQSSEQKSSSGEREMSREGENEIEEPPYTPLTSLQLKRRLSAIQYKVTQSEATEPAFRNKYWDNKKEGLYRCVVCGQSLFSSDTKFKSGTGWPSFFDPIKPDHVSYKKDFHFFYPRKEVHCSRCKAHLGHVFDDGPKDKTGKRYCMNSASLKFEPADKKSRAK